jgi:signal transduction histidine kinase
MVDGESQSGAATTKKAADSLYRRYFRMIAGLSGTIALLLTCLAFGWLLRYIIISATEPHRTAVARAAERVELLFTFIEAQVIQVANISDTGQIGWEPRIDQEIQFVMKRLPSLIRVDIYDESRGYLFSTVRGSAKLEILSALQNSNIPTQRYRSQKQKWLSNTLVHEQSTPMVPFDICINEKCSLIARIFIMARSLHEIVRSDQKNDDSISIYDSTNRLVADQDVVLSTSATDFSASPLIKTLRIKLLASSTPASTYVYEPTGYLALVSATKIGESNWIVLGKNDFRNLIWPITFLFLSAFSLLAVLFIAVNVGSRLAARSLISPIENLVRLSKQPDAIGREHLLVDALKSGHEIGALGTHLHELSSELQDYTQNLEQKVADKTHQLELANQHKSEFLANMSHELRTPLNAVIGFSDALREEYFGALNEKQREYVNDIAGSGQHLLSLINDILDLSKIEAGKMDLECSQFSVSAAIDNAMILIRERALRQSVSVSASVAEDVDTVFADERKFKQVLINLLTNAVKFTYPNGWVKVTATRDGDRLTVSVADSGLGIAAEDFEAVFQEFRQLSTTGSAKQEGTGLGLSLARRIVELHEGQIWVESEIGKGATFTFTIPLVTREVSREI